MKKVLLTCLISFILLLVTGCNSNQVVCTGSVTEDGVKTGVRIIADVDDADNVSNLTFTYILNDEETASMYCSLFKLLEDSEEGVTVDCKGKEVIIKGLKSIDGESEDEEESFIGKSKNDFIKALEQESYSCR